MAEGEGSALGTGAAVADAEADEPAELDPDTTAEEADDKDAEAETEAEDEAEAEAEGAGSKEQMKAWLGSWASPANVAFSGIQLKPCQLGQMMLRECHLQSTGAAVHLTSAIEEGGTYGSLAREVTVLSGGAIGIHGALASWSGRGRGRSRWGRRS